MTRYLAAFAFTVIAVGTSACAKSVTNWTNAMVGHAGVGSSNQSPRAIDVPDYRDCDGDLLDGRETDVNISSAHCGACHAACDGTCEKGVCIPRVLASAQPSANSE